MEESTAVRDGLRTFYERFSAHDPDGFASVIAAEPGVSVIGTGPGEGEANRESWISSYRSFITELGLRLEAGPNPQAWSEGTVGFARDEPRFVMPDGSYLPTRLTAVLRLEDEIWKIVHLHFSVGVADEDAIQPGD
jgi:hypothetical protein